jgi:hypothetical protein
LHLLCNHQCCPLLCPLTSRLPGTIKHAVTDALLSREKEAPMIADSRCSPLGSHYRHHKSSPHPPSLGRSMRVDCQNGMLRLQNQREGELRISVTCRMIRWNLVRPYAGVMISAQEEVPSKAGKASSTVHCQY